MLRHISPNVSVHSLFEKKRTYVKLVEESLGKRKCAGKPAYSVYDGTRKYFIRSLYISILSWIWLTLVALLQKV